MGDLYYGKITPSAYSATTAAVGYPATNLSAEALDMPWRATGLGNTDVIFTFGSTQTVKALLLSDVNFATAAIATSPDGSTYSGVGTFTSYADKWTDRRRGLIAYAGAGVLTVKVSISAGASTDGAAYWRIGSAYNYSNTIPLPRMPDFGMKVTAIYPKVQQQLVNGQLPQAGTGLDILELTLPYFRHYDQDVAQMQRLARAGTIGLSLVPTNYSELVLPAYFVGTTLDETLAMLDVSQLTLNLRERT